MKVKTTELVKSVLRKADETVLKYKNKYLTPDYLLYALLDVENFVEVFESFNGDVDDLKEYLEDIFNKSEKKKDAFSPEIVESSDYKKVLDRALNLTVSNQMDTIICSHLIIALLELEDCNISCYMESVVDDITDMITAFAHTEIGDEDDSFKMTSNFQGQMFVNGTEVPPEEMGGIGNLLGMMFGIPPMEVTNKYTKKILKKMNLNI